MSASGSDHRTPRAWSSLATRSALLFSALILGIVLLGGWIVFSGNSRSLRQEREKELDHRAGTIVIRFQSEMESAVQDLRFLSHLPALRQLADCAPDSPVLASRTDQVLATFAALLEGKPAYSQARLLSLENDGVEILRLDRLDGAIAAVRPSELQDKGHRDYFRESLSLGPGEVYLSKINLNREHDQVSKPRVPTIRAAAKAYRSDGSEFALVVINLDLRPLFSALEELAGSHSSLYIANADRDYLVHPDPEMTFGFDLGKRFRLPEITSESSFKTGTNKEEIIRFRKFPLVPGGSDLHTVGIGIPLSSVLADLHRVRRQSLWITMAAGLGAAAVVWILALLLARRLTALAKRIEDFEPGSGPLELSDEGNDEVATVGRKFTRMATKIDDQIEALDEARRSKERFVAHLSHEIRTPMNAVTGMIHRLVRDRPAPHQIPVLEGLDFSANQLIAVVNNVLDYSKIEAGKMLPEPDDFDLPLLLGKIHLSHLPLAERNGIRFELLLADDLPRHVRGDSPRLFQILGNLVQNALRFTRPGGTVTLTASPLAGASEIGFRVDDNGIGMSPEEIRRALTPFEQGATAPENEHRGSGLGMPIANALVTLLGGTLEIDSQPGSGTRISFTLPLPPGDPSEPGSLMTPLFSGRRILCVEDVASNREVLAALLEPTGAALTFASTARETLDHLLKAGDVEPDVVLLDLQLPDRDGADLAAEIIACRPRLALIGLTGQTSGPLLERCRAAGVGQFIWKPIKPQLLFDCLRRHFTRNGSSLALDSIHRLFDHQGERIERYLRTLHEEWRKAVTQLPELLARPDLTGLQALHHRLQNGIASVDARELSESLSSALESATRGAIPEALRSRCLTSFQEALSELESHWGEARNPPP